jgi:hypothetical protein
MAESMQSLFRRGLISPTAMAKVGKRKPKILNETKGQASKMASFDDKSGARDQGGARDKGAKVASVRHIDIRQDLGSPARASGRPSKGGFVPDQMQVHSDEIDDADNQQPAFPKAAQGQSRERRSPSGRERSARKVQWARLWWPELTQQWLRYRRVKPHTRPL